MRSINRLRQFIARLHGDQHGSLSIVSVFTVLLLTFLLGMVMNSARTYDQKIKLQNAADAATYSGGVVLARNMNTLAFTNHLLCDVFALTAFMREARDRQSESLTPEIFDNWDRVAPFMATSPYAPFAALGRALQAKTPAERDMVRTFSEWAAAASSQMLPVLEEILATEAIPTFQRSLVQFTPTQTQNAVEEVARRHGQAWPTRTPVHGVLWRTMVDPVGGNGESQRRTLPVVDPVLDSEPDQPKFFQFAVDQRRVYANRYLADWNNEQLANFDLYGKLSQFSNLWRIFTCGQLRKLLEQEYPDRNLLMQIRKLPREFCCQPDVNALVEQDFMFVGVVYQPKRADFVPGLFRNPLASDGQAFSQIMMYVPRRRLVHNALYPPGGPSRPVVAQGRPPYQPPWALCWTEQDLVRRQSGGYFPDHRSQGRAPAWQDAWSLTAQNWSMQLVPATNAGIPAILSTQPTVGNVRGLQLPNLRNMQPGDLDWVSHH